MVCSVVCVYVCLCVCVCALLAADEGVDGEKPAKRARGRPKGENKKSSGIYSVQVIHLFTKPVFLPGEAASSYTEAAKPNSSKETDWTSISWSELGQTSDSRYWYISCDREARSCDADARSCDLLYPLQTVEHQVQLMEC